MEAYVKSTIENGIGTIEFFHPQSNSMPSSQLKNLVEEINNLGKNDNAKVIILKSAGVKAFCAGASFDELISIKDFETGKTFFSGFANVINAMRNSPKLIIARIHGKAVGGGVGIACAADYTFATENASVKLSELAVGIGPFVIGPVVERKIGTSSFAQLAINATEFYSAEWAQEKSMYQDVYETPEEMDAEINLLAEKLAQSSQDAMTKLKEVFWKGTDDWDQLLTERAAVSGQLVLSEFTVNAINQFKKK
ncbi:methylglutaconyl-CoA hydratase [Epilithonimonas bovis DSM 19482]|uniref:Methylglutaconyl-CoA hydratase n=1 Tax=Epilithonimonas bovis DSM 19482 TaxID=1121284 RepID=A0A1U7Q073_9FLAO|nr:enoyl-CoA hydratase/isomerase family protein [Epilithonimonas bovis]MDN5627350.1 enoyl-CoA hydratase/isomerase family protein [Weeksellaceae bacterium]SIT97651.1 methylglutaconyl-CoA hydratase [Epilithonimonas bovis DSM 19482]